MRNEPGHGYKVDINTTNETPFSKIHGSSISAGPGPRALSSETVFVRFNYKPGVNRRSSSNTHTLLFSNDVAFSVMINFS